MADSHKNFAYSTVAAAPSPALSGTTLSVSAGHGARFPTPPFNCTVWPAKQQPLVDNAEIVRVTAINGDELTIVRTQEGSSARAITNGDQIAATITAKTLTDVEDDVATHEAAGDPHPQYLTQSEADALFLTPAEGNAAYVLKAGDTMTGALSIVVPAGGTILTLQSTALDSQAILNLQNDARAWIVYVDGASADNFTIRDATAGATRMTIDSAGNVRFSANKNALQDVIVYNADNAGVGVMARFLSSNDSSAIAMEKVGVGATSFGGARVANAGTVFDSGSVGLHLVAGGAAGVLRIYTGGAADANLRATIDSAGNIQINTTTARLKFNQPVQNNVIQLYLGAGNVEHDFYGLGINAGLLRFQAAQGAGFVFYAADAPTTSVERLRIDATGLVGIGTAAPLSLLDLRRDEASLYTVLRLQNTHVGTDASGRGAALEMGFGGYMWRVASVPTANNPSTLDPALIFYVQNPTTFVEKMRLTHLGNLLLGVTAETVLYTGYGILELRGASLSGILQFSTASADADGTALGHILWHDRNAAGGDQIAAQIVAVQEGTTAGDRGALMRFYTKADAGANTLRMTIDRRGYVAIGSHAPDVNLHLLSSEAATVLRIANNAADGDPLVSYFLPGVLEWATGIDDSDGDKFKIAASGALDSGTVMTLTQGGNVILGTNVDKGSGRILQVSGGGPVVNLINPSASDSRIEFYTSVTTLEGFLNWAPDVVELRAQTATAVLLFSTNAAERMRIHASGRVGIGYTGVPRGIIEQRGVVGNTSAIFGGGGKGIAFIADSAYIGFNVYYNAGWKAIATGTSAILGEETGSVALYLNSSVATDATPAVLEKLRVGASLVTIQGVADPRLRILQAGSANHWEIGIVSATEFLIRDSANGFTLLQASAGGGLIVNANLIVGGAKEIIGNANNTDDLLLVRGGGQVLAHVGASTEPSYSFNGDPDVGMYRVGANVLGFSATAVIAELDANAFYPSTTEVTELGKSDKKWEKLWSLKRFTHAAVVRKLGDQVIEAGGTEIITFDTEEVDTSSIFGAGGSTSRFAAPVTGWYKFGLVVRWASDANSGVFEIEHIIDGANPQIVAQYYSPASIDRVKMVEVMVYLAAGSYIEWRTTDSLSGNQTIVGDTSSTTWATYAWFYYVGDDD